MLVLHHMMERDGRTQTKGVEGRGPTSAAALILLSDRETYSSTCPPPFPLLSTHRPSPPMSPYTIHLERRMLNVSGTPVTPGQMNTLGRFDPGHVLSMDQSLVDGDNTTIVSFGEPDTTPNHHHPHHHHHQQHDTSGDFLLPVNDSSGGNMFSPGGPASSPFRGGHGRARPHSAKVRRSVKSRQQRGAEGGEGGGGNRGHGGASAGAMTRLGGRAERPRSAHPAGRRSGR